MQAQADLSKAPADLISDRAPFRRLNIVGRVGLRDDVCLHVQRPWLGCRQCEDVCPHAALARSDGALALDAARCTGCGRCAVECPTGALSVEGFELNATPGAAVGAVCEKEAAAANE